MGVIVYVHCGGSTSDIVCATIGSGLTRLTIISADTFTEASARVGGLSSLATGGAHVTT
jgi:hypothetical protein